MDVNFSKFAALREKYPDDIKRIEEDEKRMETLLKRKEYYASEETQALLALCRKDILTARVKLAKDRSLTEAQRADLWLIIDARLWFVQMVAKDYDAEIEQIDRELEAELAG